MSEDVKGCCVQVVVRIGLSWRVLSLRVVGGAKISYSVSRDPFKHAGSSGISRPNHIMVLSVLKIIAFRIIYISVLHDYRTFKMFARTIILCFI